MKHLIVLIVKIKKTLLYSFVVRLKTKKNIVLHFFYLHFVQNHLNIIYQNYCQFYKYGHRSWHLVQRSNYKKIKKNKNNKKKNKNNKKKIKNNNRKKN